MGNLGMSVSQKGYDVKDSADKLKVFSSSFQNLKVHSTYSVSTTIPADDYNTITINHNLGYIAPFVVIYNGSTSTGTTKSYFFSDSDGATMSSEYYDNCRNGANSLTIQVPWSWDIANSSTGDTVYFTVYLFLDDFRTVSPSTINTTATSHDEGDNYGIKVSKENIDIRNASDDELILSSSFFSQIVHKKGIYTEETGGLIYIDYELDYIPATLAYKELSGAGTINFERINIYEDQISQYLEAGDKLYYIVFKNELA